MVRKTLWALVLALSATPAAASHWMFVDKTGAGEMLFADSESIKRSSYGVTIWTQIQFKQNDTTKIDKSLWFVDCPNWQITIENEVMLDLTGHVLSSSGAGPAAPISPDSVGETLAKRICPAK